MKQQIIDLWKTSFEDTDAFIRLYFDRVYTDEHTLVIEKDGRIISALQILPYEMTYCGTTVTMGYVCGVCTLPSERGKGWMNRLMQSAMEDMRRRNYALATLIPAAAWLFGYYERFGYTTAFDYSLETHHRTGTGSCLSCQIVSSSGLAPEAIYAYFDRKQRERSCSVLHTAYDWETICRDCITDGGGLWVAVRDGKPAGMAFALPTDGDAVYIREIIFEQPGIKDALIQFVLQHFRRQTANVRVPSVSAAGSIPFGMARILDEQRMTELYRSFHRLPDVRLPENTDSRSLTRTLLCYDRRLAWLNLMLD
jgi:predicted acetyltransferase